MTTKYHLAPFAQFWDRLEAAGEAAPFCETMGQANTTEGRQIIYDQIVISMRERGELCECNDCTPAAFREH